VIDGALEPDFLKAQGLSILPAGGGSHAGVTYGRFAEGSARRFALAQGVEHIGVLYSQEALAETLAWFNTALDRHGSGFLDDRGPWLGLLYLGLAALAWPLARLLPRLAIPPVGGAPASWRLLWPQILAPAVLVPLLLWQLPIHVLPILLGDYLALHFGLYGLLTVGAMALTRRRAGQGHPDARHPVPARPRSRLRLAAAALAAALYGTLVIGLATDRFAMGFVPTAQRAALILAMLAGILPYFLADEWLTRGPLAPRGAYLASKAAFLLSLVIAVALNPMRLFFLIILVPAILVLFSVYGLFSRWIYQRTGYPLVAAYANALAFAWFIGVSFPVVSR
jgi:hypothetical protein